MRSKDYWEKRSEQRVHESQKNADKTIIQISGAYDGAIKNLNDDIQNIFVNYQLKTGLEASEAKRILNQKIPNQVYKIMLKTYPTVKHEKTKKWLKNKINAQAYKARITRAEALKESIYLQMKTLADVELTKSEALYLDTIKESYYKTAFDFQKGIGYGINVAAMSDKTMKGILNNPWSGKNYSSRVWGNTSYLAEQLNNIVTDGIVSGKDWRKISRELQAQMDVGKFASNRLVRTEVAYMSEQSSIASMKENGTESVEILATLDKRTSKICQKADGDIIPIDKIRIGSNHPPFHPYCRSTSVPVIDMDTVGTRIARDPQTGKNYKVPANMKYNDWKQTFVAPAPTIKGNKQSTDKFDMHKAKQETVDFLRNVGTDEALEMAFMMELTEFVDDNSLKISPVAYDALNDIIKYNPNHKDYGDYIKNHILYDLHELSHRYDYHSDIRSWENDKFLRAIAEAKSIVNENFREIEQLFAKGAIYENEAPLSDIMSALTKGKMLLPFGHDERYWNSSKNNVPKEVFANVRSLSFLENNKYDGIIKKIFDTLGKDGT